MDSLFANYASSDDEEEEESKKPSSLPPPLPPKPTSDPKPSSSFLSSLPPPKTTSSSIFSALPPPKTQQDHQKETNPTKSSLFSFLPLPKSQPTASKTESLDPTPKRVVHFTLPINPSMLKSGNLDEDDDEEERKPIVKDKSGLTPSKALSSMLPAPRNSLCLAPKKTHVPNPERVEVNQERNDLDREKAKIEETHFSNPGTIQENQERGEFGNYGHYGGTGYGNYDGTGDADYGDHGGGSQENQQQSGFENYGHYDGNSYGVGAVDYEGYVGQWKDRSGEAAVVAPEVHEMERFGGKRRRNNIVPEIVEVKQDELMKNKPRADQAKLTGIAFGPAYQPVSSGKGKPTKLHKRKHQIGSLYFDMKQKEMELAERRAKGFLTKAETQAKYGW